MILLIFLCVIFLKKKNQEIIKALFLEAVTIKNRIYAPGEAKGGYEISRFAPSRLLRMDSKFHARFPSHFTFVPILFLFLYTMKISNIDFKILTKIIKYSF